MQKRLRLAPCGVCTFQSRRVGSRLSAHLRIAASLPGFVHNAEVMNSRAAMIGFFALLAVEAVRCSPAFADPARCFYGGNLSASCCPSFTACALIVCCACVLRQITGQGFLELIGIETGNGIDIGF